MALFLAKAHKWLMVNGGEMFNNSPILAIYCPGGMAKMGHSDIINPVIGPWGGVDARIY